MFNAVNGRLTLSSGTMDYIRFGRGPKTLVMIPGVGDGLKTVRGTALFFAVTYHQLARDFTVYAFSRINELKPGATTRVMANDLAEAMNALGLERACVLGVSQGGMIAQWLAIDHPALVEKLALTVTYASPNDTARAVLGHWTDLAQKGDYRGIMLDSALKSYTPRRAAQAARLWRVLGNFGKPKSFDRFIIQAGSCLTHDARAHLSQITCPTLVIGGTADAIVTGAASVDLAKAIRGSALCMLEGLGHGLYEEDKDFFKRVAKFLGT